MVEGACNQADRASSAEEKSVIEIQTVGLDQHTPQEHSTTQHSREVKEEISTRAAVL